MPGTRKCMSHYHNKGYPWETDEGDTRHRNTVEPMMVNNDRKATLQALHTDAVDNAVKIHERNVVLDGQSPPIGSSEKELTRKVRSTLTQLRSGYWRLLGSYKSRIKKGASLNVCADCGTTPHDVKHLFVFPAHPTTMIPSDIWSRPTGAVREFCYLEARDPDWDEQQQQQRTTLSQLRSGHCKLLNSYKKQLKQSDS